LWWLIDYLAEETNADRLHIIGYSAGTRVVTNALHQFALLHAKEEKELFKEKSALDMSFWLAAT